MQSVLADIKQFESVFVQAVNRKSTEEQKKIILLYLALVMLNRKMFSKTATFYIAIVKIKLNQIKFKKMLDTGINNMVYY